MEQIYLLQRREPASLATVSWIFQVLLTAQLRACQVNGYQVMKPEGLQKPRGTWAFPAAPPVTWGFLLTLQLPFVANPRIADISPWLCHPLLKLKTPQKDEGKEPGNESCGPGNKTFTSTDFQFNQY